MPNAATFFFITVFWAILANYTPSSITPVCLNATTTALYTPYSAKHDPLGNLIDAKNNVWDTLNHININMARVKSTEPSSLCQFPWLGSTKQFSHSGFLLRAGWFPSWDLVRHTEEKKTASVGKRDAMAMGERRQKVCLIDWYNFFLHELRCHKESASHSRNFSLKDIVWSICEKSN